MAKRIRTEDPLGVTTNDESDDISDNAQPDSPTATDTITESAKHAANQAKDAAGRVVDQVKDQAASRADNQRQTVASGIHAVATAFRGMSKDLRNQEQGPVAQYAAEIGQAIGGQVEQLANYLSARDVRHLVNDAEDFARRSPAVFLGSAFVLGLAASRFLKSSRSSQQSSSNNSGSNRALPPVSTQPSYTGRSGYYGSAATSAREPSDTGLQTGSTPGNQFSAAAGL